MFILGEVFEQMISPFRKKKIDHFFQVLDRNRNGVLQPDDFKGVAVNICELAGIDKYDKRFDNTIVQSYRIFIQVLTDLEKHIELEITRDEWIVFFERNLISDLDASPPIARYITRVVYYIFNLFDINQDSVISKDEFVNMFDVYGIDSKYSEHAFKQLDLNDDQVLSMDEVVEAVKEYFFSEDKEARGNWIFGPLDE
jgi:Ca2+-binding EF-hand superfamily protein